MAFFDVVSLYKSHTGFCIGFDFNKGLRKEEIKLKELSIANKVETFNGIRTTRIKKNEVKTQGN